MEDSQAPSAAPTMTVLGSSTVIDSQAPSAAPTTTVLDSSTVIDSQVPSAPPCEPDVRLCTTKRRFSTTFWSVAAMVAETIWSVWSMQSAASQEAGPAPVPAPAKQPAPAPATEESGTPAPAPCSSGLGARLVEGQRVIRNVLVWAVRRLSATRRAETAFAQQKLPCVTREIRIGEHCIFEISFNEGPSIFKHFTDFKELHSLLHRISPHQCRLLPAFPGRCESSAAKVLCDDLQKWLLAAWQCREECEWDKGLENFCSTWSLAEDIHRLQYMHQQSYAPLAKGQQFSMKRCKIPRVSSESNFCSCMLSTSLWSMVSGRCWQVCIRFEGENGKDLLVPFLFKKGAVSTADLQMLEEWFSKWAGVQPVAHTELDGGARLLAVFACYVHVACTCPQQVGRERPALKRAIVMAAVPLVLFFVLGFSMGILYQALEFWASETLSPYIVALALITTEQWLVPSLRAYLFICWAWMLCLRTVCEVCPNSELETALALTILGGCLFVALCIMGVQRPLHAEVLGQSDGSAISICYSTMLRALPEEWAQHVNPYFMWATESSGWKGLLLLVPAGWLLFPIGLVAAELFRYNSGSAWRRIARFVIGQHTRVLLAFICGFVLGAIPEEPLQLVAVVVNSQACVGKLLFLGHLFLRRSRNTYWSSFLLVILHVVGNFLALKPWLQQRIQFKEDMDAFLAFPALWSAIIIQGLGVVVSAILLGRAQCLI